MYRKWGGVGADFSLLVRFIIVLLYIVAKDFANIPSKSSHIRLIEICIRLRNEKLRPITSILFACSEMFFSCLDFLEMKCSLIDHCLLPANHCLAAANYRLVSANYRLAPANDTILKISVSTTQPYFLNSKLKRKKQ